MPFLPFFPSRPPLFRNDSSSSSTASSSSALTTSTTLSNSSSLLQSPPLSMTSSSTSKLPALEDETAATSNFSALPIKTTFPHVSPLEMTPILLSPSTQHRPRLNHFSLSSLSIYHSRPARRFNTPIPPSLIGTKIIDSLNSPFHYRSVEGRKWSEKKDAGGTERAGKRQTGRRSDWADDVLGVLEARESK